MGLESRSTTPKERRAKPARPLTLARLERAALGYLQRHPASVNHFRRVMARKIARAHARCPGDEAGYDSWLVEVERKCVRCGMLDDQGFAHGVAGTLHRRGLGTRAIRHRLRQKGLRDPEITLAIEALESTFGDADLRAAVIFARKKRLGPFGPPPEDQRGYRRHLGALARRGFGHDLARRILDSDRASLEAAVESSPETRC